MDKKYILFDLDGTLTDSKPGITRAVAYALSHFGIKTDDLETLTPFIGPPLVDGFMTFCGFDRPRQKRQWRYTENIFPPKVCLKTLS